VNIQKLRAAKHEDEDEDDDAFTVITLPRSQQQSRNHPVCLKAISSTINTAKAGCRTRDE
jgi:hypothetical protein